jgi:hypothetical protein
VQLLRNLCGKRVTAHSRRSNFGERQEIRRNQFDGSLKDRVTQQIRGIACGCLNRDCSGERPR